MARGGKKLTAYHFNDARTTTEQKFMYH